MGEYWLNLRVFENISSIQSFIEIITFVYVKIIVDIDFTETNKN